MIRELIGRTKTATKAMTHSRFDAFDLLRADHMKAEAMLVQLRLLRDPAHRKALFRQIRRDLEKHMALEESVFYPACVRDAGLEGLIDHAQTDHQLVKDVLVDLAEINPATPRYDRLLTQLILKLEQHVIEEEEKVFKAARKRMSALALRRLNRDMIEAHSALNPPARRAA